MTIYPYPEIEMPRLFIPLPREVGAHRLTGLLSADREFLNSPEVKKSLNFMSTPAGKSCLVLRDGGTKGRGRISPWLCEVSNAPQRGRGESTRPRDEPRGACASVSSGGNNNNNNKKKPTLICGVDIVGGLN